MVADLEDYDLEDLDSLPEDKIIMFVLATYGEGEPTDNAVSLNCSEDVPLFRMSCGGFLNPTTTCIWRANCS